MVRSLLSRPALLLAAMLLGGAGVARAQTVAATMTVALQTDAKNIGVADPGDTLRYTVSITNSSATTAATAVFFDQAVVTDAPLVVGSVVSTPSGTVNTGNTGGDTTVQVDVGTLAAAGGSVTITFDVLIDDPFPVANTQISAQGSVSGGNFATLMTDDPGVGGATDPTVIAVTKNPTLVGALSFALANDADGSGTTTPGDTVQFMMMVSSTGDTTAQAVAMLSAPPASMTLSVGSVVTTTGTITLGNTAGDLTVAVTLGDMDVGALATVTFDYVILGTFGGGLVTVNASVSEAVPGASDVAAAAVLVAAPLKVAATGTVNAAGHKGCMLDPHGRGGLGQGLGLVLLPWLGLLVASTRRRSRGR